VSEAVVVVVEPSVHLEWLLVSKSCVSLMEVVMPEILVDPSVQSEALLSPTSWCSGDHFKAEFRLLETPVPEILVDPSVHNEALLAS